eukprot:560104-Amphidinium_carterae.1
MEGVREVVNNLLYLHGVTQVGNKMRRREGLQFLHKCINEVQVSALASTPKGDSPAVVPSCLTEFLFVLGLSLTPCVKHFSQVSTS